MISLTGGIDAARRLVTGAAVNMKKLAMELGGKSPNIVFDDADFETAVDNALTAAFTHSGQVCSAGCRAIVQDTIYDRFVEAVGRRADAIRLGHGRDDTTEAGALISAAHRDKVEAHVADAARRRQRASSPAVRRPSRAQPPGRLLLSPDGVRRCPPRHAHHPRGGLRSGPDRRALRRPRMRPSPWATTRPTAWPARSGPTTPRGRSASPRGSATGRCGSTTTTRTCRRQNGAASSRAGSGANLARVASTSTVRRSTSGRTRRRGHRAGSEGEDSVTATSERPATETAAGMPTLSVRNLWKVFGPAEHKVLGTPDADLPRDELRRKTGSTIGLRDVSFDVQPGEVFVVMGLSGSGKSTLVRCMTRLIEPTAGEVLLDGDDIRKADQDAPARASPRIASAWSSSTSACSPIGKVIDNVAFGLEIRGEREGGARRARPRDDRPRRSDRPRRQLPGPALAAACSSGSAWLAPSRSIPR